MTTEIKMQIDFAPASGETRTFKESITDPHGSPDDSQEALANELFAELRKAVSFHESKNTLPSLGQSLVELQSSTPITPTAATAIIDIFNRPSAWLEISNTFADLRFLLAQAKAYKDLEPSGSDPVSNPLCTYSHYRKMYMLNLAVFQLVKVQDLVVRLLQESFSGELIPVDYTDDEWEKKLTMREARKGLNNLLQQGKLSSQEHKEIVDALDIPSKSSHRETVINYRNRMTHGVRPSVDYPDLFSDFQSRAGSPIIDPSTGKAKGTKYTIVGKKTKPDYLFVDLYTALADYMGHVAKMLEGLKSISRLA
jgi:hypothetical protein